MSSAVDFWLEANAPPQALVERVGRAIVLAGRERFGGDGQPSVWVDFEDFLLPRELAQATAAIHEIGAPPATIEAAYQRGRMAGLREASELTCTKCGWRREARHA